MDIGRKKRPRDLNQWAKRMVDIATGEVDDLAPSPEDEGKDPAAVKRGRLGGVKGGKARAKSMSASERKASASKASRAHAHAMALHFMYYNFVRIHKTLRTTPAMAAGVTKRLWEMSDVVEVLETWELLNP